MKARSFRRHRIEPLESRRLLALTGPFFDREGTLFDNPSDTFQVGDLNNDGLPDVVGGASAVSSGKLEVALNLGNGRFRVLATGIPVEAFTRIALNDFNADGKLDLFSATGGAGSIWNGNGDGTFSLFSSLTVPSTRTPVIVADIDSDQKLDLVFLSSNVSQRLAIMYGTGPALFSAPVYIAGTVSASTQTTENAAITCADVNADQRPDIVRNEGDTVAVHLNLGNRQFSSPTILAYGGYRMAVADVTSDGLPDIIGPFGKPSSPTPGATKVWRNTGGGQFEPLTSSLADSGYEISDLRAADFDQDGRNDFVISYADSSYSSGITKVLIGQGDGTFQPLSTASDLPFGGAVVPTDLNKDGVLDVLVHSIAKSSFYPVFADAPGVFPGSSGVSTNDLSKAVVVDDFNEDGHLDFVQLGVGVLGQTGRVYLGDGYGSFTPSTDINQLGFGSCFGSAVDLNEDGHADLVIWRDGLTAVFLGSGTATFSLVWTATRGSANNIGIGDFNRDGHLDLATQGASASISIYSGLGNGSFNAPSDVSAGLFITSVATGDINSDGILDLVAMGNTARVLIGKPDGTFAPSIATNILTGSPVNGALRDMDRDGKPDLILATGGPLRIYKGNGDGTFGLATQLLPSIGFGVLAFADINLDGWDDLIAAKGLVYPSAGGAGPFTALSPEIGIVCFNGQNYVSRSVATSAVPCGLAAGDFNEDGKADIVTGAASQIPRKFSVLINQGITSAAPVSIAQTFDVDTRTASFAFDRPIDWSTIAVDDLRITNLLSNATCQADRFTLSGDGKTISFSLPPLPDGNYRFAIESGAIASLASTALSNAVQIPVSQSFILAGDANRDRVVNFDDLLILAQNYGQSGRTFSQGNINYSADGAVDFDDLLLLAQRYGTFLLTSTTQVVARTKKDSRSARPNLEA